MFSIVGEIAIKEMHGCNMQYACCQCMGGLYVPIATYVCVPHYVHITYIKMIACMPIYIHTHKHTWCIFYYNVAYAFKINKEVSLS